MKLAKGMIMQPNRLEKAIAAGIGIVPPSETAYVALKGTFKEYLICTERMVYIIKKGFMTGHFWGTGDFKMPYQSITNAEVDYHLATGYFELSSGGLQNRRLQYWTQDKNKAIRTQPNAVTITTNQDADLFRNAATFIMNTCAQYQQPVQAFQPQQQAPIQAGADELMKFKQLLDAGAITPEEFEMKKRQILGV